MRGRTQVSPIANKQMKKLLHLAAVNASYYDPELHEYYGRRLSEGKSGMTVFIIRNKLVARVFAIVKRTSPYVNIKQYKA
ncbi:hypothetical protein ACF3NQ_01000 [Alistipes dispar]|uniref:hypothetical protein n=1 Tax=Alistipes dispar TaxID=2585119 RepID=UPI003BF2D66D